MRLTVNSLRIPIAGYAFIFYLIVAIAPPAAMRVSAATVHVPADHATIQAGINAAGNGDTVLVEHGTYRENVKIFSKKLYLASRYVLDHDPEHILYTIIDGSMPTHTDSGSCVIVKGSDGGVVEGFTLTRGTGTLWFDPSDSKVYREGGGVLTDGGTVTVRHNLIVNNEATILDPGSAGAGGGGIRSGFGLATIESNVVAYNKGQYGAGIVLFQAAGTISNNIIWRNSGGQSYGGGGLWVWNDVDPVIQNNTIVENTSATSGGGISLSGTAATLVNNIVRNNVANTSTQIRRPTSAAASTVDYCDIQGGGFSGTGNIDRAPVWADSNYLLSLASPCVDSGDIAVSARDRGDGANPGFALFPSRGTTRNDMGAYGGPKAGMFPRFTSPVVGLDITAIDFGTDTVRRSTAALLPFHKVGWGLLKIDSVVFSPATGLSVITPLPRSVPIAFADTISIVWSRPIGGTMTALAKIYHNYSGVTNPLTVSLTGEAISTSCCVASAGNVDCSPEDGVDISDLSALIDYLYISFTPLCCVKEANIDGDPSEGVDISDLSALIDYLYISFSPPAVCL
ncbi:MAG: hypothetical protein HY851_06750 [candidate division Zixibacteria bacterium]|nr:hypothetical protein [candidate division Zixibacteria bacterium]